jgi:hypothetical protein
MAEAMARFEGFYNPKPSLAKKNNNPGNLRSWGSVPVEGGYAKFANVNAGWAALDAQIARNVERGLTLYEFYAGQRDAAGEVVVGGYPGYAPAKDKNKPSEYAAFVASFVKKNYGWTLERDKVLKSQVNG